MRSLSPGEVNDKEIRAKSTAGNTAVSRTVVGLSTSFAVSATGTMASALTASCSAAPSRPIYTPVFHGIYHLRKRE
jgi:hypothetical protein